MLFRSKIVIDAVLPDYYARFPKPCVGGWGRRSLNVTPAGKVLPCHAAEVIPNLEFWHVQHHSLADIWANSPAFTSFRGTAWMEEPCRSCERREIDYGGCRCQAFLLTGDARRFPPRWSVEDLRAAFVVRDGNRQNFRLPVLFFLLFCPSTKIIDVILKSLNFAFRRL